jgi:putative flippase GtrA
MVTMRRRTTQEAVPPVSSIRELYGRFRHLIHEGAKFLVIGGLGTIVTFGVANGLQSIGKYKAITIATVLATIVTFLGNRYWTFRHREGKGTARETTVFFVLNGVGLIIYYGCIWAIQDVAGLKSKLWYNIALVVGTGLGTLFRFWSYRKWVWTDSDGETRQSGPGQGGSGHGGPVRMGPAIARRPHGRHAANGHGNIGPVRQERLPDHEVSETSAWPR